MSDRTQVNSAVAAFALLALATQALASDTSTAINPHSLVEVRTLKALPHDVNALLGRQKDGPEGIADAGEQFNRTDVVDGRLPMRRFILAGSSLDSLLVAYEQGGRAYSIRAKGFVLARSGWREVGDWTLSESPDSLWGLIALIFRQSESVFAVDGRPLRELLRVLGRRPTRRDGPLRTDNVSDEEVREIQAVVSQVLPGSILNISGVVSECPCEDGPACSDQVWIVAHRPNQTKGLQLSRINAHWAIGPVQQWWFDFENLAATRQRFAPNAAFYSAQNSLYDRYPVCQKQATDWTATSAVGKQR